jgi:arabinogalactan oligomer / maltooligosaccharide transport system substrate-binding protein
LEACTFDGVLYCMPYATENMASSTTPTWSRLLPPPGMKCQIVGRALKAEGKVDYVMAVTGTTYDAYPLFTSLGGYIFGKSANGDWDPRISVWIAKA